MPTPANTASDLHKHLFPQVRHWFGNGFKSPLGHRVNSPEFESQYTPNTQVWGYAGFMTPADPALLTPEEHAFVDAIGQLWGDLCKIVGDGRTRDHDLAEMIGHVHALQNFVLSQAAGRAYPEMYRLAGSSLRSDERVS